MQLLQVNGKVKGENGKVKAASKRVCGSLLTHKASEAGSIARKCG